MSDTVNTHKCNNILLSESCVFIRVLTVVVVEVWAQRLIRVLPVDHSCHPVHIFLRLPPTMTA